MWQSCTTSQLKLASKPQILLVNNGSVFTKNISDFLSEKKLGFIDMPFDKIKLSEIAKFESFILSGRRQNNKEMNVLNSKIVNHAISEKKPLLGICYGAEILALTVGGTIRKMNTAQRGNNTVRVTTKNPLCDGTLNVYQSHSFEISNLGSSLVQLASSEHCNHEMVWYQNSKIFGTQFHPEMTKDGLSLIDRFVSLSIKKKARPSHE